MTTVHNLRDYRVTFPLKAQGETRTFEVVVPALSAQSANTAAVQIGYAINEASGHVWKIPADFQVKIEEQA